MEKGESTMPDRKKVIEGLETCTAKPCYCRDCPYQTECALDSQQLMKDALILLKEQEAVKPITMQRMDGNFSFFVPYFLCGNCRYELAGKDVADHREKRLDQPCVNGERTECAKH